MAKGKKKKHKVQGSGAGRGLDIKRSKDPLLFEIFAAGEEGDNRRSGRAASAALEDSEASLEAKEAALGVKQRLAYDPVALAFAGAGAVGWVVILAIYILGRG